MKPLLRWLLRLYPAGFRAEYGEEIAAAWWREWRAAGRASKVRIAFAATGDAVRNALALHAEILGNDLRLAARMAARERRFALTVMLAMAIGVGASTAIFALVNHVLLQPPPYPHADRLLNLSETQGSPDNWNQLSPADYRDWKAAAGDFASMGAWTQVGANLTGTGEPVHLTGAALTAALLPTLGVAPQWGRGFSPEDERTGAAPTVILSQAAWREFFGAQPNVVGQRIT
ncbi:MAG: ABC transporter permease, partial [Terriglobales bacterium]